MSSPDLLRKSFASVVLKSDDTKGIVEAVVNTTGGEPDHQGDVLVPGAWSKAINALGQKAPKVVWHHENGLTSDRFTVVGKVTGLRELMPGDDALPFAIKTASRGALVARMQFNLATQAGKDAYSNVAGGYVDEWSVGFMPEDRDSSVSDYNAITSAYPLLEISPVLMGASPMTATLSAKAAIQAASNSIDLSTGEVTVADTANGTPTTRTSDAADTSRKSISNRSTNVANEPTQEPGGAEIKVEPAQYLKLDDARGMFEDILKAALRDRDPDTDPKTRPTSLSVEPTVETEDPEWNVKSLTAKGYFTPAVKGRSIEGVNVNRYPRGDIENFSVARAALAQNAMQNGYMGDAWAYFASWEKQYINAAKESKMIHPITKANMGDMVTGQDGGFLAPEQWNQQLYDFLYPSSVLGSVPITRMTVPTRVVHWPILTNNMTVYYVGENAALTASSPQFRQMTATMRKQAVLAYLSNELIMDSTPQADNVLRQHAAIEMGLDQDAQALAGGTANTSSAGQVVPTGLLNMSGVTTSAGPAHIGYSDLVKGIFQVETLNGSTITRVGQTGCTGIVANPVLKKQIAALTDSNGRPLWDFSMRNVNISGSPVASPIAPNPGQPLNGWLNVPNWSLSNNVNINATTPLPTTEASQRIFFGDWRHLIIAERQDIEFMASNVAGNTFANDQTAIRLIRRYDVVCPHPEAFFILTGVSS